MNDKVKVKFHMYQKVFFGTIELMVFVVISILLGWFIQSSMPVIEQISEPRVLLVTKKFIDVEWHNRRLLDCPTLGTPIFFTSLATEQLPTRPVAASLQEQRFVRRYNFPEHLLELHNAYSHHKDISAELRILIEARCNPLWSTQETIQVPFNMALN